MGEAKPPNLFQTINGAAFFAIVGASVFGLKESLLQNPDETAEGIDFITKTVDNHIQNILIFFFIVFFRLKTAFDDHKHFGEDEQGKNIFREIGFYIAVVSWIFLLFAGILISDMKASAILIMASILSSTTWIFFHAIEAKAFIKPESKAGSKTEFRFGWSLFNALYIILISLFVFRCSYNEIACSVLIFCVLFLILFGDAYVSRTFRID